MNIHYKFMVNFSLSPERQNRGCTFYEPSLERVRKLFFFTTYVTFT